MKNITYNNSEDEDWYSFESIPETTTITAHGNIIQITEEHNPSKWVVSAKYKTKNDKDFTFITLYLQRDLPFKIFEVTTPKKTFGYTTKTYPYPPSKYQPVYDMFMEIIESKKQIDPNYVCGNVVMKEVAS